MILSQWLKFLYTPVPIPGDLWSWSRKESWAGCDSQPRRTISPGLLGSSATWLSPYYFSSSIWWLWQCRKNGAVEISTQKSSDHFLKSRFLEISHPKLTVKGQTTLEQSARVRPCRAPPRSPTMRMAIFKAKKWVKCSLNSTLLSVSVPFFFLNSDKNLKFCHTREVQSKCAPPTVLTLANDLLPLTPRQL